MEQSKADPVSRGYPKPVIAWSMVALLLVVYVFSFIDRQIVGLLGSEIQKAFSLSDTQFGLLGGYAFAAFYAVFGLLCARIADFGNRKKLIAVGVALWSLMTALSGVAKNFLQIFLCRVGVGVGEATLSPAANSMLSDSFPKERLSLALSIYSMGIPVGSALAFIIGGSVIQLADSIPQIGLTVFDTADAWQKAFMMVGAPGILLAALVMLLPEPVRRGQGADKKLPIKQVFITLADNGRAYAGMMLGTSFVAMIGFGSLIWLPSFMGRVHGIAPSDVGISFGIIGVITGPLGLLIGGALADRWWAQGRHDAHIRAALLAPLGFLIPVLLIPFVDNITLLWALVAINNLFINLPSGVAYAGINIATPNRLRGQMISIYILSTTIIGYGGGAFLIGVFSDIFSGMLDGDKAWGLRYALLAAGAIAGPSSIGLYLWGRKAFGELAHNVSGGDGQSASTPPSPKSQTLAEDQDGTQKALS